MDSRFALGMLGWESKLRPRQMQCHDLHLDRAPLIRRALQLEWLTAGWMLIEAAVAVGSGIAAHSLTLVAFGLDSIIELLSAGVLLWRLGVELRMGEEFPERIERLASKLGGVLLSLLTLYVVASAAWGLSTGRSQQFSVLGLAVAALAIPIMYLLARAKLTIAEQIDSRALRADAVESVTCGYLSVVVVAGLLAELAIAAWWIDAVSALALVPFLVREAYEAWKDAEDD